MNFDIDQISDILACPACHSRLIPESDSLLCISGDCRRVYPVIDRIPRLLPVEATELSLDDWTAAMARHNPNGSAPDGSSA